MIDGVHDLRDAVSLGLRRKIADEKCDDDPADDRRGDDEHTPSARRREQVCIIGERDSAVEKQVVEEADQITEQDCPYSRHNAEAKCESRQ